MESNTTILNKYLKGLVNRVELQHCMAVGIANLLDENKEQDTEEKLLLIYGIEVFLNEFLKIAFAWILGGILGVFPLVMFGTAYLMLLRRYAGGKHFSSNGACFAFSVFTLVPVPMVGFHVQLPFVIQLGSVLLEATLFLVYSPAKVRLAISEKDRKIRKRKTLSIYVCGLCFAYFLGGEGYVNAMLLIGLIAAFAVVEKRQRH